MNKKITNYLYFSYKSGKLNSFNYFSKEPCEMRSVIENKHNFLIREQKT